MCPAEVDKIKEEMDSMQKPQATVAGVVSPNQTAMFQGCSRDVRRKFPMVKAFDMPQTPVLTTVNVSSAACTANQLPLKHFTQTSYQEACCPEGSLECAGCAQLSGSTCASCAGGFMLRGGKCTSCADTIGWVNRAGLTCAQLAPSDCNNVKVKGALGQSF